MTQLTTSRRSALKAAVVGAGLIGAPAVLRFARAKSKRIVVRDDGGIYTKAYNAVYYKPFTQKTGIEVVAVQATAEPVAQIRSMVETKNYTWDMAKISQPAILLLTQGNKVLLEGVPRESAGRKTGAAPPGAGKGDGGPAHREPGRRKAPAAQARPNPHNGQSPGMAGIPAKDRSHIPGGAIPNVQSAGICDRVRRKKNQYPRQ